MSLNEPVKSIFNLMCRKDFSKSLINRLRMDLAKNNLVIVALESHHDIGLVWFSSFITADG